MMGNISWVLVPAQPLPVFVMDCVSAIRYPGNINQQIPQQPNGAEELCNSSKLDCLTLLSPLRLLSSTDHISLLLWHYWNESHGSSCSVLH